MTYHDLSGARILVVGASAGIGRAVALGALRDGAQVLMAARRALVLEKLRAEAGGEIAVADLTVPADAGRLAETVRDRLGGLDMVVSCLGAAPLRMIEDTTDDDWQQVLQTNLVGVHRLMRACLPLLTRDAQVMALSSESVDQPRTGLGAYVTSKAALERLFAAWRAEHPWLRFTTVAVGATYPSDFANSFDDELFTQLLKDWSVRGLAQERLQSPEDVAAVLLGSLASARRRPGVCVEHLVVRSPSPVVGTYAGAIAKTTAVAEEPE
jgi:NAD(P)-dependent dehydrogenase (short-subunit alcohol dehydrogenase family)